MAGFNILPITEIIDPGSSGYDPEDERPEWDDTTGKVEWIQTDMLTESESYTLVVVCDHDMSQYDNPVWVSGVSGFEPTMSYQGWVYTQADFINDDGHCTVNITRFYVNKVYYLSVVFPQPQDEYTNCDCYGEDGYWDKTSDTASDSRTYTENDTRKYYNGQLSIYPEIRVSGTLCPTKSLSRNGWVRTSLELVYAEYPYSHLTYVIITEYYIFERLYCTYCPDEDIEFPENDPLYEYSEVWYEWEEAIDCGYGQREEAYINCNQMYRCKWKPGWEWVPEDPNNPDNTGGSWVPDEVPPPGPWIPDDGGDGEEFPGVGTPLDDYTSCCDFVPKDFIAWADGWNMSVLDEPK